jgi:undecaprenyl-diphosphatase
MKKKVILLGGVFVLIVFLTSLYFDPSISRFFASLRFPALNQFFLGVGFIDNEIALVALLTLFLVFSSKKREWIFPLWLTVLSTGFAVFFLKYSVQRQRPFAQGIVPLLHGVTDKLSYHTWDFSFPSFDTALVFCTIPLVWKFFPRFRYLWVVFSVLVGLSRIYFGVHFLSDVIAGAVIGFFIGFSIIKLENKTGRLKEFYKRIFRKK